MTVTLNVAPEIEVALLAQAQARGMALEDYLQSILEQGALPSGQKPQPNRREEAIRRMLEFGDKYRLSLCEPITRALLHEGHRF